MKEDEVNKIFSGECSRDMWKAINDAKSKNDLRDALYLVCCRLQEFESRIGTEEIERLKEGEG